MGGTRFKEHNSVRLPAHKALTIESEVIRCLKAIGIDAEATISFPGKADYGDLDIIISEEDLLVHAGQDRFNESPAHRARKALIPVLGAEAMAHSGPKDHATSYLLPTHDGPFQLDLITYPRNVVAYARRFYAWGDLGALVSMTARRLGLSNKASGLHVVVGQANDRHHVLLLTDYNQALGEMGFDAAEHEAGFATHEQAFKWISHGRHFDPETYRPENLTHASRTRAIRRPMQIAFRKWLTDTRPPACDNLFVPQDADGGWTARQVQGERMLTHWKQKFPHVATEEQKHNQRNNVARAADKSRRNLMSATTIADITGHSGDDLKNLMWGITKHPRYAEMMDRANETLRDQIIVETCEHLQR